MSRLDSIPDPLKLDPITTENQSKESRINGSVHQKTTPSPISGIGLLEPNMNESHSSSDNQPPLSDTKALSQSLSEVDEIERRRQRRTSRRAKKRQMSQNDEDESTLKPDDGGERRELPGTYMYILCGGHCAYNLVHNDTLYILYVYLCN